MQNITGFIALFCAIFIYISSQRGIALSVMDYVNSIHEFGHIVTGLVMAPDQILKGNLPYLVRDYMSVKTQLIGYPSLLIPLGGIYFTALFPLLCSDHWRAHGTFARRNLPTIVLSMATIYIAIIMPSQGDRSFALYTGGAALALWLAEATKIKCLITFVNTTLGSIVLLENIAMCLPFAITQHRRVAPLWNQKDIIEHASGVFYLILLAIAFSMFLASLLMHSNKFWHRQGLHHLFYAGCTMICADIVALRLFYHEHISYPLSVLMIAAGLAAIWAYKIEFQKNIQPRRQITLYLTKEKAQ